jgi:hypothetical protein
MFPKETFISGEEPSSELLAPLPGNWWKKWVSDSGVFRFELPSFPEASGFSCLLDIGQFNC